MLVKNEIEILKTVRNPNIIQFHGDFKENNMWYLSFEYCPHGDLHQFLKQKGIDPTTQESSRKRPLR